MKIANPCIVLVAALVVLSSDVGWTDDGPLPKPGYARKLREAAVKVGKSEGVRLTVRLIPDAYRYEMAVGMEDLSKRGSDGPELLGKLRTLHRKHRKLAGKMLILAELAPESGGHVLLTPKLKQHIRLETQSKKTSFSVTTLTKKPPKPRSWEVYEYPIDQPRRLKKMALVHLDKTLRFSLLAKRPSGRTSDPVVVELAGVAVQMERKESTNSINARLRQISCQEWREIWADGLKAEFFPRKYKRPKPPQLFETLLEQLSASR